MIDYHKGAFSVNLIWRFYGSAIYRAMFPGLLSLIIFVLMRPWFRERSLFHPRAVGALLGSISLLIVFRLNHSYRRFWSACEHVFGMMSWFLDSATHMAGFHLHSDHLKEMRPPSFFDHHYLNQFNLTRHREHTSHSKALTRSERQARSVLKSIEKIGSQKRTNQSRISWESFSEELSSSFVDPNHKVQELHGTQRLDGGWGSLFSDAINKQPTSATFCKIHGTAEEGWDTTGFASTGGGRTPSLYLQELAHLVSLLNAVALSTLRNNIEAVESPLGVHHPGNRFPSIDTGFLETNSKWEKICHFLGADRSLEALATYSAAHPIPVIGGVSDAEVIFLQKAKGSYAKVQLAMHWLTEFIIRESKAGSSGPFGDAIISRIMQFLGSGMARYNSARKITMIPFPYVHAQLSIFFVLAAIPSVPYLMTQYTTEIWIGGTLTFLAVTCLVGIHEVARELESPFRNVPNDVPLATLQAQFNEGIYVVYAGFHPDHYWDTSPMLVASNRKSQISTGVNGVSGVSSGTNLGKRGNTNNLETTVRVENNTEKSRDPGGDPISGEHSDPEDTIQDLRRKLEVHEKEMKILQQQLDHSYPKRSMNAD